MHTTDFILSAEQLEAIQLPSNTKLFLEGIAGTGKTTASVERMLHLLSVGVPGESMLVLLPQRTLADPFYRALEMAQLVPGGAVTIMTLAGLARRMTALFWPLLVDTAGFSQTSELPTFLTLETAQYYLARLVRPLLDEGMFSSVRIDRNRLYSQILDNLNKAAVVGFPHTEIGERLITAWVGDPGQVNVFKDVQTCVNLFREFCLKFNLVDFSLQIELFHKYLWTSALCKNFLLDKYQHLIFENLEEDTPITHDIIREWLPEFESAWLTYDQEGGYRQFLGADAHTAYALKPLCSHHVHLTETFVCSANIRVFEQSLAGSLDSPGGLRKGGNPTILQREPGGGDQPQAFEIHAHRYNIEMLDWVIDRISLLINDEGISPGEIVVLAPYMPDSLRFMIMSRMSERNIPVISQRPSRSLREEPAAQCLLTLAALAFPEWQIQLAPEDITHALMGAIKDMDLIRARLLTKIVYRVSDHGNRFTSFDLIMPEVQARITYRLGEKFENLRLWLLDANARGKELDLFFSRAFGEVLSQPGYGFYQNFEAARITANLIESVNKFRWVARKTLGEDEKPLGKEFLLMVQDGVIAAQYVRPWKQEYGQMVLIAPAYTYLMSNRSVDIQFWLDVGSRGWFERLNQPLTHPYVLSRNWAHGRLWTDKEEYESSLKAQKRLVTGLLHRCRQKVYMGISELGTAGYEQRGPLLQAIQRSLIE